MDRPCLCRNLVYSSELFWFVMSKKRERATCRRLVLFGAIQQNRSLHNTKNTNHWVECVDVNIQLSYSHEDGSSMIGNLR